jgi:hypothetical protein
LTCISSKAIGVVNIAEAATTFNNFVAKFADAMTFATSDYFFNILTLSIVYFLCPLPPMSCAWEA